MRKIITIICLILSSLIILDSFNFGNAVVMFVLAGVIPGTTISLSPTVMMQLFGLSMGVVVGRLSARFVRPYIERLLLQPKRA